MHAMLCSCVCTSPQHSQTQNRRGPRVPAVLARSDKIALDCLRATGWGIEAAIEYFYASGLQGAVPNVDMRAIEALFTRYKGEPAGQGRARVAAGGGGPPPAQQLPRQQHAHGSAIKPAAAHPPCVPQRAWSCAVTLHNMAHVLRLPMIISIRNPPIRPAYSSGLTTPKCEPSPPSPRPVRRGDHGGGCGAVL
jgi:hypothetical protein